MAVDAEKSGPMLREWLTFAFYRCRPLSPSPSLAKTGLNGVACAARPANKLADLGVDLSN